MSGHKFDRTGSQNQVDKQQFLLSLFSGIATEWIVRQKPVTEWLGETRQFEESHPASDRIVSVKTWFLLPLTVFSLNAAELPDLIVPQGAGVNIHFTRGHERELDLMAAAGIKFVRMDFGWAGIERRKGEYDWSAYDELTANLEKRALRALYILDYSNALYEESVASKNPITGNEQKDIASPQQPESVAAFARWAAAAAEHFKGRRIIWEIWNEPNISFWKPKPDVKQYTTLAVATAKAIRQADPNATVIGPATSEVPLPFLEAFFAAGALAHLDAVSVHPYRSYKKGPETAVEDYAKLRALIDRYAPTPEKKRMPIISGEWGYSTFSKGVSLETQAAFAVRQQLANLLAGVPISIWYDWKNDGLDPNEREHNFGLVENDLKLKPAYTALQKMTRELNGFRIERRLDAGNSNDFVLLLSNSSAAKALAAWTAEAAPHDLSLGLPNELATAALAVSAVNGDGSSAKATREEGRLHFELAPLPKYIHFSSRVITPTADPQPVPIPPAPEILRSLRKEHPRLFATEADFAALRQRIAIEPTLQNWRTRLREQAERILGEAPSKYEIPDGLRLLGVSRRVLSRVQTLGLLYRLEGDKRLANRVWTELEAAANFPDWNPRHFLDTAEMTHAFAIGYDWLYDAWTPEQRGVIRAAIIEKGLKPALNVYRGNPRPSGSWNKMHHNWNQVCNGGIGIGALAIADEEPTLAGELLRSGLNSIQLAMRQFAPDGAWVEGPGYWNYATTYNVALLAALESALGTDFGLPKIPGFAECGTFPLYLTGPLGRTFNYADGSDGALRAPHMFWLAHELNRPEYAAYQQPLASPHPLDLLWWRQTPAQAAAPPLDKHFRGAEVVTLRSAWENRNALFVGFKAGDNKANHSNLDLGTFVFDALGARWALDLGADDYNLPGYFGNQRWNYYRMRAEGHNTLVINPDTEPDQPPSAAARITRFESKPELAFAIAELTTAYARHARGVKRGVALLDRERVLLQDEIQAERPAEVWWFLHTRSAVRIADDGMSATLTEGDARLRVTVLSPANARLSVRDAVPLPSSPQPPKQNRNEGVRKLAIELQSVTDARLAVLLEPYEKTNPPGGQRPAIKPLAQW